MSLLSLAARFSRPALCTFQTRVFFHSSQKRARYEYTGPESLGLLPRASEFTLEHVDLLKLSFKGASAEKDVIPEVEITDVLDQYVAPHVTRKVLCSQDFNVLKYGCISDPEAQTFITNLHENVKISSDKDIDETLTYTIVNDLLRIFKLNSFPLMIRNKPYYEIYIQNEPLVVAEPEFVIHFQDKSIIAVEDKHLNLAWPDTGFGEAQLAIEILASGCDNLRQFDETEVPYRDQTIFAVRVVSTYVTFYKAFIPAKYWHELDDGLPNEQSIEILRWPAEEMIMDGFDLAEPNGRQSVLTSLAKISQFLFK